MSRVCVKFFALFREEAGTESIWVDTDAANLGKLFMEMGERYNLSQSLQGVKVAVNDGRGLIAAGRVTRVVVDEERFMEKATGD